MLTSAYFLSFSLAQLPVGLALDKYGPKRVQLFLLSIAATGSLLFYVGKDFSTLLLARILIGLGLSACFMGSIKILSFYVPSTKLPSIHSYLLAAGGLGAMLSTLPVAWIVEFTTWRSLFLIMAGLIVVVMFTITIWTPADPVEHRMVKWPTLSSLLEVYKDKDFLRVIALFLLPHTVSFGLAGLWLGKWLEDVGHFSTETVSLYLFISMGAVIVGALSVGSITEWAGKYGLKPMEVGGVGIGLFILIQTLCALNCLPLMPVLSVAFTLIGAITGLDYTIVAQRVSPAMTGRTATCLNLLILFGAFLIQTVFGFIVDFWPQNSQGQYPSIAYQMAFLLMVLLQIPGFLYWLMRVISQRSLRNPSVG